MARPPVWVPLNCLLAVLSTADRLRSASRGRSGHVVPKVREAGCGVWQIVVEAMESLPWLHGAAGGRTKGG